MSDPFDDEAFEDFLRQFEPRAPSALPARRPSRIIWALAAAALIAVGLYVGLHGGAAARHREARHDTVRSRVAAVRPTMGDLSVVMRPGDYAGASAGLEMEVLADPRRSGGALRALAER
jgi:hypothetical protein